MLRANFIMSEANNKVLISPSALAENFIIRKDYFIWHSDISFYKDTRIRLQYFAKSGIVNQVNRI